MEITSPTLDQGPTTPEFTRNLSRVKFEVLNYNPYEIKPKKPSILSRIFSFLGGFAPLAFVAAPFTGGMSLIGAAALGGLGAVGNQAKAKQQQQNIEAQRAAPRTVMTYPGLAQSASISPGTFASDPSLVNLISTSRTDALYSSPRQL